LRSSTLLLSNGSQKKVNERVEATLLNEMNKKTHLKAVLFVFLCVDFGKATTYFGELFFVRAFENLSATGNW
jgi:hypothetical protein